MRLYGKGILIFIWNKIFEFMTECYTSPPSVDIIPFFRRCWYGPMIQTPWPVTKTAKLTQWMTSLLIACLSIFKSIILRRRTFSHMNWIICVRGNMFSVVFWQNIIVYFSSNSNQAYLFITHRDEHPIWYFQRFVSILTLIPSQRDAHSNDKMVL